MQQRSTLLNNRIFALQKTKGLPDDLRLLLYQADIVYLQDSEDAAAYLVEEIERECRDRSILIYDISKDVPVKLPGC